MLGMYWHPNSLFQDLAVGVACRVILTIINWDRKQKIEDLKIEFTFTRY
jgi:hypothetical protein